MKITHEITKKIESGKRRLFFKYEGAKNKAEFAMSFRSYLYVELYTFSFTFGVNENGFFFVDVPTSVARFTAFFRYIVKEGNELTEEIVYKSAKRENLYETKNANI